MSAANEAILFIQESISCLGAAKHLFICNKAHPIYMFPAAVLCHHGIELLLKTCLIWNECEYEKTHKLLPLAKKISFLKLNQEHQSLLREIDTYYSYRYSLKNKDYQRIKEVLKKAGSETILGSPDLPCEIGTDTWVKVRSFYGFLTSYMPEKLIDLFKKVHRQSGIREL